jgi:C4-dicarboxylate-specific signal transduction histidine kinase
MSGPGVQMMQGDPAGLKGRTPLAHLLHALNQPLTGLQCSLELASVRPRPAEEYGRTLRDALELTARMRVLVEALREIADSQASNSMAQCEVLLNDVLSLTVQEVLPVADAVGVRLVTQNPVELCVRGDQGLLAKIVFRLLDSALSLAREKSDLRIVVAVEEASAVVRISWVSGPVPEFSPFSRPELGLLIAQAGWEDAGGLWMQARTDDGITCELRMSLMGSGSRGRCASNGRETRGAE